MKVTQILTLFVLVFLSISFTSATVISDVSQDELLPGGQTSVDIEVKNTLNDNIEDVSLTLVLANTPFISIGSSEDSTDEIKDDDEESFGYTIKAAQDIEPGNYNLPYELTYTDTSDDEKVTKKGTIGIVVSANTEIDVNIKTNNNVVGQTGRIDVEIVNRGFGDIKFANVKLSGNGFTIVGSDSDYIGNVDSDDFETASFDVIFNDKNADAVAIITFKDFDNNAQSETVSKALNVYSQEEAIQLGIIQKNNTFMYVGIAILILVAWIVFRRVMKSRKKKKQNLSTK